ncbi:hypothetical protein F4778DRAFT_765036 [Xylariomycetidae sp. FL2044]|nr:hypothetical protein F4778DRAFT_765036 [Xylariomycetidae sp. FL2044]
MMFKMVELVAGGCYGLFMQLNDNFFEVFFEYWHTPDVWWYIAGPHAAITAVGRTLLPSCLYNNKDTPNNEGPTWLFVFLVYYLTYFVVASAKFDEYYPRFMEQLDMRSFRSKFIQEDCRGLHRPRQAVPGVLHVPPPRCPELLVQGARCVPPPLRSARAHPAGRPRGGRYTLYAALGHLRRRRSSI